MDAIVVEASWFRPALVGGLIVANGPLYWVLYRLLFADLEELWDAVCFLVTPDLLSAIRGAFWDDVWAELKLGALVGVSAGAVYLEYDWIYGALA